MDLFIIYAIDLLAIGLGLFGMTIGILIARQSYLDRIAGKIYNRNGWFRLHTLIGIRTGLSGSIGHFLLGSLGLLGLFSHPPPSRYLISFLLGIIYVFIQCTIVIPQFLNYRDGNILRKSGSLK